MNSGAHIIAKPGSRSSIIYAVHYLESNFGGFYLCYMEV